MKQLLEYSQDGLTGWQSFGVVRPRSGQLYRVSAVDRENRAGAVVPAGYGFDLIGQALTLSVTFLDQDEYFWRVTFPEITASNVILLGEHPYVFDFDSLADRNRIFQYQISISFKFSSNLLSVFVKLINALP